MPSKNKRLKKYGKKLIESAIFLGPAPKIGPRTKKTINSVKDFIAEYGMASKASRIGKQSSKTKRRVKKTDTMYTKGGPGQTKRKDITPATQYKRGGIFGRKKYTNIASSMGENSKVVVTDRKLKEKGTRGKIKHKYDRFGNLKKTVRTKGLKRVVIKPKRDSRKTMANTFRNIIDNQRTSRFSKGGIIQHD